MSAVAPDSLELTAAVIVAGRHSDEWREVLDRLEAGEDLELVSLDRRQKVS